MPPPREPEEVRHRTEMPCVCGCFHCVPRWATKVDLRQNELWLKHFLSSACRRLVPEGPIHSQWSNDAWHRGWTNGCERSSTRSSVSGSQRRLPPRMLLQRSSRSIRFVRAPRCSRGTAKTITRWNRAGRLHPYGLRGERVRRAELEQLMAALPRRAGRSARPRHRTAILRRLTTKRMRARPVAPPLVSPVTPRTLTRR
jgi:hypothetical protein